MIAPASHRTDEFTQDLSVMISVHRMSASRRGSKHQERRA